MRYRVTRRGSPGYGRRPVRGKSNAAASRARKEAKKNKNWLFIVLGVVGALFLTKMVDFTEKAKLQLSKLKS